jgi:hypothetical protein
MRLQHYSKNENVKISAAILMAYAQYNIQNFNNMFAEEYSHYIIYLPFLLPSPPPLHITHYLPIPILPSPSSLSPPYLIASNK